MRLSKMTIAIFVLWGVLLMPVRTIDPSLALYEQWYNSVVSTFCDESEYTTNQSQVMFSDLTAPEIGVCVHYGFGYIVQIDRKFWENASPLERLTLMTHELSHCKLKIDHNDDPNHYMYKSLTTVTRDELVFQLAVDAAATCSKGRTR